MFAPAFFPVPDPPNEAERQAAVERSHVLSRGNDSRLQAIVEDAVRCYRTPFAAITIIDRDRQWLAVRIGLDVRETPRDIAFCAHTIHRPGEPLVVTNAALDPRFAGNPVVRFAPHVRFYAGMPIVDRAGYALGALCVIDFKARDQDVDPTDLMLLARQAERVIAT